MYDDDNDDDDNRERHRSRGGFWGSEDMREAKGLLRKVERGENWTQGYKERGPNWVNIQALFFILNIKFWKLRRNCKECSLSFQKELTTHRLPPAISKTK